MGRILLRHISLVAILWPLLAQAIPLGAPHPVTPRTPGIAAGRQDEAAIASSGQETLVAWIDEMRGRDGIYVAQLATDGSVVHGKQRWLVEESTTSLAFTWTGQSYLVVWLSQSAGDGVWAMTIDSELRTLTPARRIYADGGLLTNVVWIGNRGAAVAGRRLLIIDRDANVVASVPDVLPGLHPLMSTRVAASDDSFALFHHLGAPESILLARRYSTNGQALDAAAVEIARVSRLAEEWDVAFGGERFALVATEMGDDADTLRRFLIAPATLQTQVLSPLQVGRSSGAHVEWVGDRFVAFWLDRSSEVVSIRTDSLDETPLAGNYSLRMLAFTDANDSAIVIGPSRGGSAMHPDEIWNGSSLAIAYTFSPWETTRDIHVETTDWRTGQTTRSAISRSMQWQSMAGASTDGRTALVAWLEGDPTSDVMRVAMTRMTPGASDRPVVYLSESAIAVAPVVVSTGSMYLVLWLEWSESGNESNVAMQRVSRDGALLDTSRSIIASGFGVGAAWNGTHALVAWSAPAAWGGTRAVRLGSDGRITDAAPFSLPAPGGFFPVAVASNGSDFMIVWPEGSDGHFPLPDLVDLHASRITADGIARPAFPVATGPTNQRDAAIASDGRDYLIVYTESPREGDAAIVTKKILREGTLTGTTASTPGTHLGTLSTWLVGPPSVASTTNGYVVAWEEEDYQMSRVRIATVDREGSVAEPPATIAESDISGTSATVVTGAGSAGHCFYSSLEGEPTYGRSMRLLIRQIGEPRTKRRAVR